MGGSGSGRGPGLGLLTDKCEEYKSVDLAWLRRHGSFRTGTSGRITWSRGGIVHSSINYRIQSGGLRLIYRTRPVNGEWSDIDELTPFTTTETQFEGRRRWLQCLSCGRRCRIIYGGSYFRCRRCYRLKYESQYEPIFARAASKAHKLRERLGYVGSIDDPFPPKPKGMHWKTYRRLEAEDERLQTQWAMGCMGWMNMFQSATTR